MFFGIVCSSEGKTSHKTKRFFFSVVNCIEKETFQDHRQKYKTKAKNFYTLFFPPKKQTKNNSLKNLLEKKVQPTNSANIGLEANFFSAPAGYERPVFF